MYQPKPGENSSHRILEMCANLIAEAKRLGMTPTKPVTLKVFGENIGSSSESYEAQIRHVVVAHTQPAQPAGDTLIWVDAVNRKMFKATQGVAGWKQVFDRRKMFIEAVF